MKSFKSLLTVLALVSSVAVVAGEDKSFGQKVHEGFAKFAKTCSPFEFSHPKTDKVKTEKDKEDVALYLDKDGKETEDATKADKKDGKEVRAQTGGVTWKNRVAFAGVTIPVVALIARAVVGFYNDVKSPNSWFRIQIAKLRGNKEETAPVADSQPEVKEVSKQPAKKSAAKSFPNNR